ncbi:MAG TPA: hypothetical protein VIL35_15215 [Vicinamibacterales bacterium]
MSEPRIGRLVVATLHEAIAETLPLRLEFYENWLQPLGLLQQGKQIGAASFSAALSFLRREDPPTLYDQVTRRAGELTAEWTFAGLPWTRRQWVRILPARLRARAALRMARGLARAGYPGSRLIASLDGGTGRIEVRGSIFCQVREAVDAPLCGFYAGLIVRLFAVHGLDATCTPTRCRASGGHSCELALDWRSVERTS